MRAPWPHVVSAGGSGFGFHPLYVAFLHFFLTALAFPDFICLTKKLVSKSAKETTENVDSGAGWGQFCAGVQAAAALI